MSKNLIQYKLIKEYPNSPKKGTIHYYIDENDCSEDWLGTDIYKLYKEYWEFIDPKNNRDYEILGYYTDSNNISKIKSVKRLTDCEVFKVGEYVECWNGIFPISEIFIYKNKVRFFMDFQKKNMSDKSSSYTLYNIKKVSKFFTTDDGMDIFNPEQIVYIVGDDFIVRRIKAVNLLHEIRSNENYRTKNKIFYDEFLAEKYVKPHKRIYSRNDILRVFNAWYYSDDQNLTAIRFMKLLENYERRL